MVKQSCMNNKGLSTMFRTLFLTLGISAALASSGESLSFLGSTDANPLLYACGEEMVFTIRLVDTDADNAPVPGRRLQWMRRGDDGKTERGEATSDEPLIVKTRIDKPGFVRLTVNVLDSDGRKVRDAKANRDVCWDGGAGADVNRIPRWTVPADLDAFWDARISELNETSAEAALNELPSRSDKVFFAAFKVPMPGDEWPAQGLVAWPKEADAASLPLEVEVTGYGFHTTAMNERRAAEDGGRILLSITRQGEHPRQDAAYYENIRTNLCKNFCFRNNGGRVEETDFAKMLLRNVQALRWAKTLPAWNGKDICVRGGSMGGYQAIGLAALDPSVTAVRAASPWCADLAGYAKFGRMGGWCPGWTSALDYVSLSHLAPRVRCPVEMDIGLGDYVCPPSGQMLLFNALGGPKTLKAVQNRGHGSCYGPTPPEYLFREAVTRECQAGTVITSLNGAWRFRRTDKGPSDWQTVSVPHDWAIAGPFDPQDSPWQGKLPWQAEGEYCRTVQVDGGLGVRLARGARAYLEFDGVMARPEVFVNGARAGSGDYGYLGFTLDVTELLHVGTNEVRVTATTKPQRTRFYCGGGLYRDVRLVVRDADHVVPGTLAITTPEVSAERARVCIRYVSSRRGPQTEERIVERPRLWDVGKGELYEIEILGERFRYGIRTVSFNADKGFVINGRRVQLKGVNLHADLGPVGMAFDRDLALRQLLTMKDMGVNALRTSHNCPAPQVLDLCDELGIVVWDECFDKWEGTSGRLPSENMEDYVSQVLARFVRRDRNHPSVVAWSIGNEIWKKDQANAWNKDAWGETGMSAERFRRFRDAVRHEDATRPVGIGCCGHGGDPMFAELDLTGWNYGGKYAEHHAALPRQPVVYTESASAVSETGFYGSLPQSKTDYARTTLQVSSYDHCAAPWGDIPDVEFMRMARDTYCAGEFVWTGIDYLGEPTPIVNGDNFGIKTNESATARSSYFGIVDLTGVPKDRFYLYRSHWNDASPTVRLCPSHWNFKSPQSVFVYTSGDSAELFLNGKSLGLRRKGEDETGCGSFTNAYYDVCSRYRLRWFDVPNDPGELKAVAYRDGAVVGEDVVRTAGEPVALRLTDCPYNAAAAKTRVVLVEAVDVHGTCNPLATDRVSFRLEGPGEIVAVGNANPRGYESFKAVDAHSLHYGRCAVYVRRTGEGRLVLRATVSGLAGASLELGVQRVAVGCGETLYNGIALPAVWPPKINLANRGAMEVPYLEEGNEG
jgi:beta-galactosidase